MAKISVNFLKFDGTTPPSAARATARRRPPVTVVFANRPPSRRTLGPLAASSADRDRVENLVARALPSRAFPSPRASSHLARRSRATTTPPRRMRINDGRPTPWCIRVSSSSERDDRVGLEIERRGRETPLDVRSFVRPRDSLSRATRTHASRHPSVSSSIHLFILHLISCIHPFGGGHRRVMIGDASKPYVSRMTTAIDIRNADVIDVIDRSSHKTIDRFHRSHRSHRSFSSIVFHRSHRSQGSFPPPRLVSPSSSRRAVSSRSFETRVRAPRAFERSNRRARERPSFVRSFVRLVPLSSRPSLVSSSPRGSRRDVTSTRWRARWARTWRRGRRRRRRRWIGERGTR